MASFNAAPTSVLVLGASGKTGRRVARRLDERGIAARAGSRSADPPFDWTDRSTWSDAVQDAEAVYVSYQPDLAVPGAEDAISAFATLAVERGVRRLVLLSGRGEPEALRCEQAARSAGGALTVVRASWFAQNFSESFFLEPLLSGEVVLPAGTVAEPFVDADDIADVAVAALTEPGHAGQVYEVTGPRLLTFAEAVAEIAAATGRELAFVPVSLDAYIAELQELDLPDEVTALMRYLFGEVLDGRNAHVSDGVQRALGRPPRDFAAFARDEAAAGTWDISGAVA